MSIPDRVEVTIDSIRGNLMPQQRGTILCGMMDEAGLIPEYDITVEEVESCACRSSRKTWTRWVRRIRSAA